MALQGLRVPKSMKSLDSGKLPRILKITNSFSLLFGRAPKLLTPRPLSRGCGSRRSRRGPQSEVSQDCSKIHPQSGHHCEMRCPAGRGVEGNSVPPARGDESDLAMAHMSLRGPEHVLFPEMSLCPGIGRKGSFEMRWKCLALTATCLASASPKNSASWGRALRFGCRPNAEVSGFLGRGVEVCRCGRVLGRLFARPFAFQPDDSGSVARLREARSSASAAPEAAATWR